MATDGYSGNHGSVLERLLQKIEDAQKLMPGKMSSIDVYLGDAKTIYEDRPPKNYEGTSIIIAPEKVYFEPGVEVEYLAALRKLNEGQLEDISSFLASRINVMSMERITIPMGTDSSNPPFCTLVVYAFP